MFKDIPFMFLFDVFNLLLALLTCIHVHHEAISVGKSSTNHAMVRINKAFEGRNLIMFLFVGLNICCGCSKAPSQLRRFFEHPKHISQYRNKNKNF